MHFADDARVRGERVLRGAGRQVVRAEHTVESTLRANPLALGAVAVAIGAAIGLSLPHTQTEDQWMGAAKDRLLDKAEGAAGDAIHKAEAAVGELTSGEKTGESEKSETTAKSEKPSPTMNRGLSNGFSGPPSSSRGL